MNRIRIGIIGSGRMAALHAEKLTRLDAQILFFVGRGPSVEAIAARHGAATFFQIDTALPAVDAYVIASATDRHVSDLLKLASFGKPIFCEKPIAVSNEQLAELDVLSSDTTKRIYVGYHKRFDDKINEFKKRLNSQPIHSIHIINYDPVPPAQQAVGQCGNSSFSQNCGSIFVDFTIHDLDLLTYLIDDTFQIRQVFHQYNSDNGEEESVVILKSTELGIRAVIENSRNCGYGHDQRISVLTDYGQVTLSNPVPIPYDFINRYDKAYEHQMSSFIDQIIGDNRHSLMATLHDGIRSLKIALSCESVVNREAKRDYSGFHK